MCTYCIAAIECRTCGERQKMRFLSTAPNHPEHLEGEGERGERERGREGERERGREGEGVRGERERGREGERERGERER